MDRAHVPVGADVPGSLVLDADAVEANRLRRSKRLRASRDPEPSPHALWRCFRCDTTWNPIASDLNARAEVCV